MHRILTCLAAVAALSAPVRAEGPRAERGHPGPMEPPPEEERRIPAMFEEVLPARARHMRETGREHPDWFRRALKQAHRMARELEELRETNLEAFERRVAMLRKEEALDELAEALRRSPSEEAKAPLRRELRAKLEELFDLKEAEQRTRVERMERELKTLKERLDKRRQARKGIIERRLREIEEGDSLEF